MIEFRIERGYFASLDYHYYVVNLFIDGKFIGNASRSYTYHAWAVKRAKKLAATCASKIPRIIDVNGNSIAVAWTSPTITQPTLGQAAQAWLAQKRHTP